jgi:hypothetical protein
MQTGQRLDGRDDGREIPRRAGRRLGCLRLRRELRCQAGLVLRLVLRGGCCDRSFGHPLRTESAALLLLLLHNGESYVVGTGSRLRKPRTAKRPDIYALASRGQPGKDMAGRSGGPYTIAPHSRNPQMPY